MSTHGEQIVAAARGKLDQELLGAAFAKPRGATTAGIGGGAIASEIGSRRAGKHAKGADAAGIVLGNPGAVGVTSSSLVTMAVKVSFGGQIKDVTEVLSEVPLTDIQSIEVKRMGLAGVMEINSLGTSFKLEGKVNDMREFADAFERAKASA